MRALIAPTAAAATPAVSSTRRPSIPARSGAGRGRRGGARADAERARRVVQVADDAIVVHALAVAEPRGLGQHRGGGNPETVGEREPGDAGALTTDAGLVGDETAHAALKRE